MKGGKKVYLRSIDTEEHNFICNLIACSLCVFTIYCHHLPFRGGRNGDGEKGLDVCVCVRVSVSAYRHFRALEYLGTLNKAIKCMKKHD